jgi:protein-S-isoprenylcysteine O-methyltransferase Ste14
VRFLILQLQEDDCMLQPLGLIFWALLAGFQLHNAWADGSVLALLLAVESGLIGCRLVLRRSDRSTIVSPGKSIAAWISLFIPLLMRGEYTSGLGQTLALGGIALTLWGLSTLGPAFGIAPADRGLVTRGPYGYLRHPMYAGAVLNALGYLVSNLSSWNLLVFVLLAGSACLRIRWEEALIGKYAAYAAHVPWRLLPGIW